MTNEQREVVQRIVRRVEQVGDCWLWAGASNSAGYGVIRTGTGRGAPVELVHRVTARALGLDLDGRQAHHESLRQHDNGGTSLTMPEASSFIDALRPLPKFTPTIDTPLPDDSLDLRELERYVSNGIVRFGVPNADTRLKVTIRFKANGTIYVDDGAVYGHRQNYGVQRPGQGYAGAIADELRAIIADPAAAAMRYAELTSRCSSCNRHLEQKRSVAEGMGPVCARRFFD